MADATEIEITFTLKSRYPVAYPTTDARDLMVDMREAFLVSKGNKTESPMDWKFDIKGEAFKITSVSD